MAIETPSLPHRLDGIQVLRGFAAAAVAWHHALEVSKGVGYAAPPPDWLVLLGAAGVDVFFVISGFIMVFISARRGEIGDAGAARRFLGNRVKRIYPLYWLCCAIFLLAMAAGFFSEKVITAREIAASLLLWFTDTRIVGISWTLSYEMFFYLVFAVSLFARSLTRAALVAAGAIIAVVLIAPPLGYGALFIASPIVLEFVFGMAIGLAFVNGHLRNRWLGNPLVALMAIGLLAASSIAFYAGTTHRLPDAVRWFAWGGPSILLVLYALNVKVGSGLAGKALVASGDASYATYLFHTLILVIYAKAFELVPALAIVSQWIWVPLVTLGCLIAGWVIHMLAEKPLMRALSRGKRASAGQPASA